MRRDTRTEYEQHGADNITSRNQSNRTLYNITNKTKTLNNLVQEKNLPLLFIYIYIQKQCPHKMVTALLPLIAQRIDAAKSPAYTPQSAKHEDRGHMGHRETKQNNEIDQ